MVQAVAAAENSVTNGIAEPWYSCETFGRMNAQIVAAGVLCAACCACGLATDGLAPVDATAEAADAPEPDAPFDAPADAPGDASRDSTTADASLDAVEELDASEDTIDSGSVCAAKCTMEGGACEGDGGQQCSVYCGTSNPCEAVRCPDGIPCYVDCTGQNACAGGVDCADASSCTVICAGGGNCGAITCGGQDCQVYCLATGACPGPIVCQASNSCAVTCGGTSSCAGNIRCTGLTCDVTCSGAGACEGGECCEAGSCSPQATPNCP